MITINYRATFIPNHYSQTFTGNGQTYEIARKDAERQLQEALTFLREHESQAILVSFVSLGVM